jgi:hypothetical protein
MSRRVWQVLWLTALAELSLLNCLQFVQHEFTRAGRTVYCKRLTVTASSRVCMITVQHEAQKFLWGLASPGKNFDIADRVPVESVTPKGLM